MRTKWLLACGLILTLTVTGVMFDSIAWAAAEDYAGAYTCTFGGDITGMAIMQVDADGYLYGVIWSEGPQTVDIVAGWASVDDDGNFDFTSHCGMQVVGAISTAGEISGTWTYTTYTGSFSGQPDDGSVSVFAGDYSGTFGGDASGTWTTTISSEGEAAGQMLRQGESTPDTIYLGLVDGAGNIIAMTYSEISIKGTVDTSGAISGTWSDGTYSGTFTNQAAADSGGGGGGGCFLNTMMDGFRQ